MKKVFQDLIFAGRLEKQFKISGHTFTISTLTASDMVKASSLFVQFEGAARLNAARIAVLAYAIKSIDGEKFESEEEAVEVLEQLQHNFISIIFEKYNSLVSEQEEAVKEIEQNEEELKN